METEKKRKDKDENAGAKNEAFEVVAELEKKLVETEAKLKEMSEQPLRLKADFENTRKRLERDKLEAIKYANERLLAEILPVLDTVDHALASISEGHDPEKVKQGLQIAQEELHKVLELHGVEVIKALGSVFDPRFHEAVAMVETAEAQEGFVVEEIQRGYVLNGRLIRPSRVKVAQEKKS